MSLKSSDKWMISWSLKLEMKSDGPEGKHSFIELIDVFSINVYNRISNFVLTSNNDTQQLF